MSQEENNRRISNAQWHHLYNLLCGMPKSDRSRVRRTRNDWKEIFWRVSSSGCSRTRRACRHRLHRWWRKLIPIHTKRDAQVQRSATSYIIHVRGMTRSSHTCFSWEQVNRTKSTLSFDHSFPCVMPRIEDVIAPHPSAFADDYDVYVDYGQGRPVKMNNDEATFTDVERFLLKQFDSLKFFPDRRSRWETKGPTALKSSSFTLATRDNRSWVWNVISGLCRWI